MSGQAACGICGNWESKCLCPMHNDADSLIAEGPLHVVAAAVRRPGRVYAVKRPARHHNVMGMMRQRYGLDTCGRINEQGFLLSDGTFATRSEALPVARAAGQVRELIGSVLTSEDLW